MKVLNFVAAVGAIIGMLAIPGEGFAAQWVTNVTVTDAIIGRSGTAEYVQFLTSGTIVNPGGCSSADSYIIDPAIGRSALAIGLAAISAERKVRVYVTDQCDAATGRPLVSSVGLMQSA
jgi:hypothetical protein